MTKMKLFAAAAMLSSMIVSPVMAQEFSQQPAPAQYYRQNPDRTSDYQMNNERRDSGFWPADVAAGAVGTADAIATAPFRNDAYADDDAYNDSYAYDDANAYDDADAYENEGHQYMNDGQKASGSGALRNRDSYAARNGFVCQPGSWFRGADGRQHICQ